MLLKFKKVSDPQVHAVKYYQSHAYFIIFASPVYNKRWRKPKEQLRIFFLAIFVRFMKKEPQSGCTHRVAGYAINVYNLIDYIVTSPHVSIEYTLNRDIKAYFGIFFVSDENLQLHCSSINDIYETLTRFLSMKLCKSDIIR